MSDMTIDAGYRLKPVKGINTLRGQAYTAIKEAILSLHFKPGTPLIEDELAEQLGISKTPVRDALIELERDGLVVRIPYKGTYVSEISERDAQEIFELRAVLEGLAGRLAVASLTSGALDEAEAILDACEAALEAGRLGEASGLGEQFHRLVLGHAANQRLQTFLEMLDEQTRRLRQISNRGVGRLEKSAAEHRQIMAALREGDPEKVDLAFRYHHRSVLHDLKPSRLAKGGDSAG